ncbi:MAG TPA: MFS transporter [Gaiellaceae bacterium]|nr:MFS transporter [Gaiellaceae bacterium]
MPRRSYLLRDPAPLSWALYDFAYSVFSFLLVVRYFGTWVIDDLGRPDWYVAMTQFVVVLFLLVAMPLAGALADQLGRRKPFLLAFTLVSACACALIGVIPADGNVLPLLLAGAVAVAFGQLALAQYDPLLADVAPRGRRGHVSGIAVALGFVGIFFGLAVVAEGIVGDGSKQRAFVPAAALFVIFALPAFLWIRERRQKAAPPRADGGLARNALTQVAHTAQQVRANRDAFQFLVGRFFYSDAIATLSAFLTVYMTRVGGFSETEKNAVLAVSVVGAATAALVTGRLLGSVGPRAVLLAVLPTFSVLTLLSAAVGEPWTVWLAAPVMGSALGCVWTADRVFMIRLTPLELRGQMFGFFNLASRAASAFGPLVIWSATIWVLHEQTEALSLLGATRVALVGLALAAFVGWLVIRPLSDAYRSPSSAT